MVQNTFFTMFDAVVATFTSMMFYLVLTAKSVDDLNEPLKTRPFLAKAIARPGSRSYLKNSIYFGISLFGYCLIAGGGDVGVDIDTACLSLIAFFFLVFFRVRKLRQLLGKPVKGNTGVSQ
ncbi:hypothetical protein ACO0LO_15710 [Undibacterium sp. TJN25]|uniref:hypothetical protein n=1 Tax=Undibacterium sp. TJN25 TaxID=3413056 RepID=UPI003BF02DA4